jgi:hypothetical protein
MSSDTSGPVQQVVLQDRSAENTTYSSMSQFGTLKSSHPVLCTTSEAAISVTSYASSSDLPENEFDAKIEAERRLGFDEDAFETPSVTLHSQPSKPTSGSSTVPSITRKHRRTPHRLIERHYREGLNSRFDDLRDAIPGPSKLKTTKAGVLAAAISHIQQLETVNAELQSQMHVINQSSITFDTVGVPSLPMDHQRLHRTYAQPVFCHTDAMMAPPDYGNMHSWRTQ